MAVDLEELAQFLARVGTAEAVGAEHAVLPAPRDERADLVGEGLDVIGGCHHRPGMAPEALLDPGDSWRFGRMQQIPALAVQSLAAQLGETGAAPDIRAYVPVLLQQRA